MSGRLAAWTTVGSTPTGTEGVGRDECFAIAVERAAGDACRAAAGPLHPARTAVINTAVTTPRTVMSMRRRTKL
jgi:hypothetical protein